MDSDTLRGRVLGRLDAYDAEHDMQGCTRQHCIHDGIAAARAMMELHRPADHLCVECQLRRPCPTERVIAEALGIWDGHDG